MEPGDLLKLAKAYCRATGLTLRGAAERACGERNHQAFIRLLNAQGITLKTALAAETYFKHNWPTNARWPRSIPGGPLARVPKFTARATRSRAGNTPGGSRSASP